MVLYTGNHLFTTPFKGSVMLYVATLCSCDSFRMGYNTTVSSDMSTIPNKSHCLLIQTAIVMLGQCKINVLSLYERRIY